MNRRTACIRFLAAATASLLSSCMLGAEAAVKTIARIAGPHWNVNGDWTPSIEVLQHHLRDQHGIDPDGRDLEDLITLHDNDHNRRGYSGGHAHKKSPKAPTKGYAKF